jgi:hypothetical protein
MFDEALLDIEAVSAGIDPCQRENLVKLASLQRENYDGADIRLAAALAKTAFEVSGQEGSPHHLIFSALLKRPAVTEGHRKLASVVFCSLGTVTRRQKQASNPALTAWQGIRSATGSVAAVTPEVFRMLTLGMMAAGGVAGGGAWAFNRSLTGEDEKLRQLEIQRDTYGQLSAEVKAELARRKMDPTPANQAAAVDYLT